jgi:hypothetical protein
MRLTVITILSDSKPRTFNHGADNPQNPGP